MALTRSQRRQTALLRRSLSSDQNGSLYKTYLEDKLAASQQLTSSGSAGAHPGAPRSLGASPRPPSGNLSDGGIYGCGEDFHRLSCATGCTVGSCEWRAGSSDGDSVAAADADGGGNATMPPEETASVACWADLPDGILREVHSFSLVLQGNNMLIAQELSACSPSFSSGWRCHLPVDGAL